MLIPLASLLSAIAIARRLRRRPPGLPAATAWLPWLLPLALVALAAATLPSIIVFRKFIASLILPTGIMWLALLWGCWILRRRRAQFLGALALTLLFTVAGNHGFATWVLTRVEAPYRGLQPLVGNEHYEAVFVLGGGVGRGANGSDQLGAHGDRLRLAAALHHQGRTPFLVASGLTLLDGHDLSTSTAAIWESLGIPEDAILRLPGLDITAHEIEAYAEVIERNGWHHVGLVTSASHMRRAQLLCRRHGLQMAPLPADFLGSDPSGPGIRFLDLSLVPKSRALEKLETALWEVLGILAVRLTGF